MKLTKLLEFFAGVIIGVTISGMAIEKYKVKPLKERIARVEERLNETGKIGIGKHLDKIEKDEKINIEAKEWLERREQNKRTLQPYTLEGKMINFPRELNWQKDLACGEGKYALGSYEDGVCLQLYNRTYEDVKYFARKYIEYEDGIESITITIRENENNLKFLGEDMPLEFILDLYKRPLNTKFHIDCSIINMYIPEVSEIVEDKNLKANDTRCDGIVDFIGDYIPIHAETYVIRNFGMPDNDPFIKTSLIRKVFIDLDKEFASYRKRFYVDEILAKEKLSKQ